MIWRPSIFMPRWASRITLEVTGVRVERVQQISGRDAQAEGVDPQNAAYHVYDGHQVTDEAWIAAYADLWNEINAKRGFGWDANPWVWVVKFRKIEVQA